MAVGALSTSAIALTASQAPIPTMPQAVEMSQAFAQLVAGAKPDGKTPQDAAKPEISAETETETAIVTEEASTTLSDGESGDAPPARPTDLLADIEAMLAAASQFGVSQPIAAPATPLPAAIVSTPIAPDAVATRATAAAIPTAAPTVVSPAVRKVAAPGAAETAGAAVVTTTPSTPADAPPALPIATAPGAAEVEPEVVRPEGRPVAEASPDQPAEAARGGIATLSASLKSTFQRGEARASTPTPIPTAAAVTADGAAPKIAAAPAATPTPVLSEDHPAEAIVAPAATVVATVATVVTAPARATAPKAAQPVVEAIDVTDSEPTGPITADARTTAIGQPADAQPVREAAAATAALPRVEAAAAPQPDSLPIITADIAPTPPDIAPASADIAPTPADVTPAAADFAPAPDGAAAAPIADTAAASTAAPTEVPTDSAAVAADPAATAALTVPLPTTSTSAAPASTADTAVDTASPADQSIDRHLDLARDTQWLDRLARDISQAATQQGHLKFQLNPEHLGALTVEIANSAAGTAIRLTAETDQARTILADAQPRLLAEVRAQGLRVAESHVDLNQQGSGGSTSAQGQQQQQQQQRPSADHKPFASTQNANRDDAVDSAPSEDGELYA